MFKCEKYREHAYQTVTLIVLLVEKSLKIAVDATTIIF